jgi:hypothetical protein
LRKLLSIALLVVFGLPFASSLLALSPTSDANLPACCRRHGKHHCSMSAEQRARLLSDTPSFTAPPEHCPFAPAHAFLVPGSQFAGAVHFAASSSFAGLRAQPIAYVQPQSTDRAARERSNQERGPPTA